MGKNSFNITDFITESDIIGKVHVLGQEALTPTSHNFKDYGSIKIIEAAEVSYKNYHNQAKALPAIALIEVVLAANRNYNKVVLPNIERLKKDFPGLISFDDLNTLLHSNTKEAFFKIWGHKDKKKYIILKNILSIITTLKHQELNQNGFEIMNNWAKKVDVDRYAEDEIGSIKNMGLATVQHLRMVFGANTVKPDQRVIEVLGNEFKLEGLSQMKSIRAVEQISEITKKPALLIDQIFVLYGSGYYNRMGKTNFIDQQERVAREIALRLKSFNVDPFIIAQSTNLSLQEISDL